MSVLVIYIYLYGCVYGAYACTSEIVVFAAEALRKCLAKNFLGNAKTLLPTKAISTIYLNGREELTTGSTVSKAFMDSKYSSLHTYYICICIFDFCPMLSACIRNLARSARFKDCFSNCYKFFGLNEICEIFTVA